MVDLREPLEELVVQPTTHTKNRQFLSPERILIHDETIRDGEQMPGLAFSPEQKLEIAEALSDLGIDEIMVGFPSASESERRAFELIVQSQARGRINPKIEFALLSRALPRDIEDVVECAKDAGLGPEKVRITLLSTTSDLHLKYKLGKALKKRATGNEEGWLDTPLSLFREANIEMITAAVKHARAVGLELITCAAEDASRSHLEYFQSWAKACVDAGADSICYSDTCGVLTPEGVEHYFPPIAEALGTREGRCKLWAHFHNDYGLAAVNTAQALSYGATTASMTINGIGERAGNTSLHEVVMILKDLYGITLPRLRYENLVEIRRLVERVSGIPLHPHAPIVGEGVFSHESGIHTSAILIHPAIYQVIAEEQVGGTHRFVYGKHSGTNAITAVLEKHAEKLAAQNVSVDRNLTQKVLDKVKRLREERIAAPRGNVERYYEDYHRLGVSELAVVELAIAVALEEGTQQGAPVVGQ